MQNLTEGEKVEMIEHVLKVLDVNIKECKQKPPEKDKGDELNDNQKLAESQNLSMLSDTSLDDDESNQVQEMDELQQKILGKLLKSLYPIHEKTQNNDEKLFEQYNPYKSKLTPQQLLEKVASNTASLSTMRKRPNLQLFVGGN